MLKYIIKRLVYGVWVVFGVIVIEFFIFHAIPGNLINIVPRTDPETRALIIESHGLDKPLPMQFVLYINDLSLISVYKDTPKNQVEYQYQSLFKIGENSLVLKKPYLRRSFQTLRRVDEIIFSSIGGTIWLTITAMLFASVVGIILGLLAALNSGTSLDSFLVTLSVIGISAPSFVSAILIAIVFGYYLHDITGLSTTGSLWEIDPLRGKQLQLKNLILPAITLGLRPLAIITQITRSSMLEVMSKDYIRTAKAKGLNQFRVVMKHALKNALNPVITAVSGWFATLMAGAFFIEYVFNWKGIGLITLQAVENKDFPVVMGTTLFVAIVFILVSIIVDVLYSLLDPKVRLE